MSLNSVAIVAIPRDNDSVWKYSSEKVPHMTMLFLGDLTKNPDVSQIVGYVSHIASTFMRPFGMTVDSRGTLGPDNADVLFFKQDKTGNSVPYLARQYMLDNPTIRTAYDSIDQYPDWIPHLTMGYPKTPAKKDDREYPGFFWVEFDKIAVWTEEDSGPTFKLEYPDAEMEVMMNDRMDAFFEHHGVKGQKWGVRNDKGHVGEKATNKKIAKLDKNYEKKVNAANAGRLTPEFHNAIVSRMNARVTALNDSDKYRDVDLSTYTGKIKADYERDSQDVIMRSFEDATREIFGSNASGTKKAVYNRETDRIDIVDIKRVQHSENLIIPDVSIQLIRNKKGLISSTSISELKHFEDVEDFLEHHGILGMKWGVRRENPGGAPSGKVTVDQKTPGGKVEVKGGHGFKLHEDAAKAAAAKAVARNSGTHALSTAELRALVDRMNLEQQYSKLSSANTSQGKKFVSDLLVNVVKQQATKIVNEQAGNLINEASKKANKK